MLRIFFHLQYLNGCTKIHQFENSFFKCTLIWQLSQYNLTNLFRMKWETAKCCQSHHTEKTQTNVLTNPTHLVLWYMYISWEISTIQLMNMSITSHLYLFVVRTLRFYSLSKYRSYNTVLSTAVTLDPQTLFTSQLKLCALRHPPFPLPAAPGNLFYSLFLGVTFSSLRFTYKW